MKTEQWAPSGNLLDGIPGRMLLLLASDGKTYGYAGGPGNAMTFGHAGGKIDVRPKQWVTRYDDGRITVTDDPPAALPGTDKEN